MINKFKDMVRKDFTHEGNVVTIESIEEKNDYFLISFTDGLQRKYSEDEIKNDFTPINNNLPAAAGEALLQIIKNDNTQMNNLCETLLSNIRKVQADPKFIDQARAINENAKTVIDIKKTQIEMLKLLKS